MLQFIDAEGLTHYEDRDNYLSRVRAEYPGASEVDADSRLLLLASLQQGAGVQIITGPLGKEYWSLASVECQVSVWPDGYDYKERHDVHT